MHGEFGFRSQRRRGSLFTPKDPLAVAVIARCPHCRTKLRVPTAAAETEILCPKCDTAFTPVDEKKARACPECRARLPAGAVFCVDCGFDMRSGQKLTQTFIAEPKQKRRRRDDAIPELPDPALKPLTPTSWNAIIRTPFDPEFVLDTVV